MSNHSLLFTEQQLWTLNAFGAKDKTMQYGELGYGVVSKVIAFLAQSPEFDP